MMGKRKWIKPEIRPFKQEVTLWGMLIPPHAFLQILRVFAELEGYQWLAKPSIDQQERSE